MIRDYLSDTLELYEDYYFNEDKLVLYRLNQAKKLKITGRAHYWFHENILIDSSTFFIDPFETRTVLDKANRGLWLAKHKKDSLYNSIELLKDTLKQLRALSADDSINSGKKKKFTTVEIKL